MTRTSHIVFAVLAFTFVLFLIFAPSAALLAVGLPLAGVCLLIRTLQARKDRAEKRKRPHGMDGHVCNGKCLENQGK